MYTKERKKATKQQQLSHVIRLILCLFLLGARQRAENYLNLTAVSFFFFFVVSSKSVSRQGWGEF